MPWSASRAVRLLAQQSRPLPIIDMHLHANRADDNGPPPTYVCPGFEKTAHDPRLSWEAAFSALMKTPPCANPLKGAETDEALMKSTFEILERRNIIAVTSGPVLERWRAAGNERIIPAAMFNFGPTAPSIATLRDGFAAKRYAVFGEVGIQYQGVSPSDPRFEPYLAVAEAADVPLGIHVGIGPPGAPYLQGLGNYRARLHSPLELEEALVRHPKLRVYIMHAGWPMLDDLLAVLWTHPQVQCRRRRDLLRSIAQGVSPLPRTDRRRRVWQPGDVRLGPDELAGRDRVRHRGD